MKWTRSWVLVGLVALSACQGELEDSNLRPPPSMDMGVALPDQGTGPPDVAGVDYTTAFSYPQTVNAFEAELAWVETPEMPGGVVGVAHTERQGTYLGGPDGLFLWRDGELRRVVQGDITQLAALGERGVVWAEDGDAMILDGAVPQRVFGGLKDPGALLTMAPRGDALWLLTDQALWTASRDQLRGDRLERRDPLEGVTAMFGAGASETLTYWTQEGELFVLDVEGMTSRRLTADAPLTFAFSGRTDRILGLVGGKLAERHEGVWRWKALTTSSTEIVEDISHGALDSVTGAVWLMGADAIHRVESGWVATAPLPQGLDVAEITSLHPTRDGALWIMTGSALGRLEAKGLERPALLDPPMGPVGFAADIKPIADAICRDCHISGQGGALVRLETYDEWKTGQGTFDLDWIIGSVRAERMPKENDPIPSFADLLEAWRAGGLQP